LFSFFHLESSPCSSISFVSFCDRGAGKKPNATNRSCTKTLSKLKPGKRQESLAAMQQQTDAVFDRTMREEAKTKAFLEGARRCPECQALTLKCGGCNNVCCTFCGLSYNWRDATMA
jgi:hypothetical protein